MAGALYIRGELGELQPLKEQETGSAGVMHMAEISMEAYHTRYRGIYSGLSEMNTSRSK